MPIRLRSRDDFRCNYEYRWPAHKITSNQAFLVYSTPHCMQCKMTYVALDAKDIPYTVVDLRENPAALEYVTGELGYTQAPIVVVSDDDHWSGFRPDMIERIAAQ